jgi:hypothetical protein
MLVGGLSTGIADRNASSRDSSGNPVTVTGLEIRESS